MQYNRIEYSTIEYNTVQYSYHSFLCTEWLFKNLLQEATQRPTSSMAHLVQNNMLKKQQIAEKNIIT